MPSATTDPHDRRCQQRARPCARRHSGARTVSKGHTSAHKGRTSCIALALISLLGTGALAGCGSSGSSGEPASLVPVSAPLYANVAVKPSGGSGGDASTAAKDLTHLAEPYGSLAQALLSSEGSHVEFKRDIEPWVGQSAGIFITSLDTSKLPRVGAPLRRCSKVA